MYIQQLLAVTSRALGLFQLMTSHVHAVPRYQVRCPEDAGHRGLHPGIPPMPPLVGGGAGRGIPTDTAFGQSWPDAVQTHEVRVEDAVMVGAEPVTKDEV